MELRFSVPKLEVVGRADEPSLDGSQGLRINIQAGDETLDFDAPKMHTLTGKLEVFGAVTTFVLHQYISNRKTSSDYFTD